MDQALVRRAQKGDMDAFEQLVHLYEKKVYTMALRACGHAEDAADISQEVFLRVYRALPQFRGDASFSTWLYRMVSNLCIDHARKQARRFETPLVVTREDGEEHYADIPDARYAPEEALERTQMREAVNSALLTLTPDHRSIVVLREINGLSYEEIAQALLLEPGTVKSRLARARAQMRKVLTAHGNLSVSVASNSTQDQTEQCEGGEDRA